MFRTEHSEGPALPQRAAQVGKVKEHDRKRATKGHSRLESKKMKDYSGVSGILMSRDQ